MPEQAQQIVATVEKTKPKGHGLPGANGTLKKLKGWVLKTFGLVAGRGAIRRTLRQADLSWKKIKKLLGKANPEKRAAHIPNRLTLFVGVRDRELVLIYVDEAHVHRDLDLGYTWGRKGERLWRNSACPKRSDRLNAYGAYDFTNGPCFLGQNGWCNGEQTVQFLRALVRRRSGQKGRVVVIGDNAPMALTLLILVSGVVFGLGFAPG